MCLESNLQIYLFIGFVLLGIIYLTILKLKHIRKKKFNIRLLFTIIIGSLSNSVGETKNH